MSKTLTLKLVKALEEEEIALALLKGSSEVHTPLTNFIIDTLGKNIVIEKFTGDPDRYKQPFKHASQFKYQWKVSHRISPFVHFSVVDGLRCGLEHGKPEIIRAVTYLLESDAQNVDKTLQPFNIRWGHIKLLEYSKNIMAQKIAARMNPGAVFKYTKNGGVCIEQDTSGGKPPAYILPLNYLYFDNGLDNMGKYLHDLQSGFPDSNPTTFF